MSEDPTKGYLIDGFPRALDQGEHFEKTVCKGQLMIWYTASEDVMVQRLLKRAETSGRADDNIETIKKRLNTYNEATAPVLAAFKSTGRAMEIDAGRDIDLVFADSCAAIEKTLGIAPKHVDVDLSNTKVVFVLGGPGTGKGTQCAKLVERYNLATLSAGDLLRAEVKKGGPRAEEIGALMKEGKIVPMEVTIGLVKEAMSED